MNTDLQRESPGAHRARIILACLATALLVFMGLTAFRALRDTARTAPADPSGPRSALSPAPPLDTANLRTVAGEHFIVAFPLRTDKTDAAAVVKILEGARADLSRRLGAAQLSIDGVPRLEIILHESTGDFTSATGQPWWAAAATKGPRIELQPLDVLRNRGVLETTLRHEYTHAVIESLGHGTTPRWLAEGLALTVAGEGPRLAPSLPKTKLTPEQIDRLFTCETPAPAACPANPVDSAQAYAAAYAAVQQLIKQESEPAVWRQIAGIKS